MRNYINSWLAVVYLWGRVYYSSVLRLFETKYLTTTLPTVTSLADIERVSDEVEWTSDFKLAPHVKLRRLWWDCISYAETVWAKKKDDCDGFAVLDCKLLDQLDDLYPGIKGYLLSVFVIPRRKSHAVCLFVIDDVTHMFTNGSHVEFDPSYQITDVVDIVAAGGEILAWSLEDPETNEIIMIKRGINGDVPKLFKRRF